MNDIVGHGYPYSEEEMKRISEAIAQSRTPHQHTYQMQIANMCMVRWCTICGKAWKCERPQNGSFFGDYWEPILERDEEK